MGFFPPPPPPPSGGSSGGVVAAHNNSALAGTPVSGGSFATPDQGTMGVSGQFYHSSPVATSLGPNSNTAGGFRPEATNINLKGVNNGTWNPFG